MARVVAFAVLVVARTALAQRCPPAVALTGEDAAVRAVRDPLAARGIVTGATPACAVLRAHVERRGALLVGLEPSGAPWRIEREVVEISGPRAEAHVAVSLPLTAHIAIDIAASGELTQATAMEPDRDDAPLTSIHFPDEPRALFRLAPGIRHGAP